MTSPTITFEANFTFLTNDLGKVYYLYNVEWVYIYINIIERMWPGLEPQSPCLKHTTTPPTWHTSDEVHRPPPQLLLRYDEQEGQAVPDKHPPVEEAECRASLCCTEVVRYDTRAERHTTCRTTHNIQINQLKFVQVINMLLYFHQVYTQM